MDRFDVCLPRVLAHEGGYVNHPKDPGGATNKGITQRTYDAWTRSKGGLQSDVRHITAAEVASIYREQYWQDGLPVGLDYAVFDYAVNSGPAQAARDLQRVLGVSVDGVIGTHTRAAAQSAGPDTIEALCKRRLAMLKGLRHWGTFGKGWQRRVDSVLLTAIADATGQRVSVAPVQTPGHADPADKGALRTAKEAATDPAAVLTGGASVLAGLSGFVGGSGPVQWAIAAVLVIAAVTGAVLLLRRAKA